MRMSEQTNELFAALSAFRGDVSSVVKRGRNPHLKSAFVRLPDIWDAIEGPLVAHGLTVNQFPDEAGHDAIAVTTIVGHKSGQWISSTATMPASAGKGVTEQQAHGIAYTYLQRYALSAALGLPGVDDDGEGTRGRGLRGDDDGGLSELRGELARVQNQRQLEAVKAKLGALPPALKPQLVADYKAASDRVAGAA